MLEMAFNCLPSSQVHLLPDLMKNSKEINAIDGSRKSSSLFSVLIVALSLVAIVATYFLANSSNDMATKTRGFSGIIAAFLISALLIHLWGTRGTKADSKTGEYLEINVDRSLIALDEANEYFAGSLNSSDSFRLVASRVKELVSYRTMSLLVLDKGRESFRVADSEGADAEFRKGRFLPTTEGVAGRSFLTNLIEFDRASASSRPAIAIPLRNGSNIYGVLQLEFDMSTDVEQYDPLLLEAIGSRSAPLILSSLSYEQSRQNALTDVTTDLPNERAFQMVLENQVAESVRKGAARPLTILALDVRAFDSINDRFGHAAGDRVLNHVSQVIKDNLRQMDFFARASADEFLVVLPTASKEVSHEVIARIQTGFFGRKLKITDTESLEIEINVGWAAFGTDGETPDALVATARERKEQAKTFAPSKVLWFPTEFAG